MLLKREPPKVRAGLLARFNCVIYRLMPDGNIGLSGEISGNKAPFPILHFIDIFIVILQRDDQPSLIIKRVFLKTGIVMLLPITGDIAGMDVFIDLFDIFCIFQLAPGCA